MIFGVTNSIAEFDGSPSNGTVIRGVGCHPGDAVAIAAFNRATFAQRAQTTSLVGEVGLDRGSPVPMADQRRVCEELLDAVREMPRLVSLHSVRAQTPLLDLLKSVHVPGAILHWWTGSAAQTSRAIDLGCWFSIGPGMVRDIDRLSRFPRDRVLTETDAPVRGAVAGRVDDVETAFAAAWNCDIEDVRKNIWRNFAALVAITETQRLLPVQVRALIADVNGQL